MVTLFRLHDQGWANDHHNEMLPILVACAVAALLYLLAGGAVD